MAGPGATSSWIDCGIGPTSYSSSGFTSSNNNWAGTIPTRGKPGGGAGSCQTASGLGGWGTDSSTYSAMTGPVAGSYATGPGGVSWCAGPGVFSTGPGGYGGGGWDNGLGSS